jgi:hypothetical protein
MRLESRSQPPEAGGKQKSRNGHQEASIHEKTSYEAVKNKLSWQETYRAMAAEDEDWSDLDATLADGLG